jgi:hypothetical protein
MPMNLPEISENDGATVKYHDYTDTKNYCSIAVAFVASKLFFFCRPVMFFFGDCMFLCYGTDNCNPVCLGVC